MKLMQTLLGLTPPATFDLQALITPEQMAEDIQPQDEGEYDYEGSMAKTSLRLMIEAAQELHDMLADDENLPEWAQAKLVLAEDYIDTVRDYMKHRAEAQTDSEEPEQQEIDEAGEYMWDIEGGAAKGKKFMDKEVTVDDHLSAMKYHSQEYHTAMKEKRDADARHHGMKYHKHKDQIENMGRSGDYLKDDVAK
jgi:hypothetical protein